MTEDYQLTRDEKSDNRLTPRDRARAIQQLDHVKHNRNQKKNYEDHRKIADNIHKGS